MKKFLYFILSVVAFSYLKNEVTRVTMSDSAITLTLGHTGTLNADVQIYW